MGPTLLCDKSTLQSLGPKELNCLRRFYFVNIPPVLLVEILGDLKKPSDSAMGEKAVRTLARKLIPACSMVNLDYRLLVQTELEGGTISLDYSPVVAGDSQVQAPNGETGIVVEEQAEARALHRWQDGRFREAERLLAEAWREITKSVDLEHLKAMLKEHYTGRVHLRSLAEADALVTALLSEQSTELLLTWFLHDIGVPLRFIRPAVTRFIAVGSSPLSVRAPFTCHCLRASLLFHFALSFSLVSTRPTNRVDLEYLFYLPFCHAFTSGDKLHRQLAPFLLTGDRMFLERDELSRDLARIAAEVEALPPGEQEMERRRLGPPENGNSPTHRVWKQFMREDYRNQKRLELTPEMEKKLVEEVLRRLDGPGQPIPGGPGPLGQGDFAVRKFSIAWDGPCFCGSNRIFRVCCGQKLRNL